MTINEIVSYLDTLAPFSTAMEYDNVGLLIGSGSAEVSRAVVSLDATMETLEYALAADANLVITHHPIIFDPLRRIQEDSAVYQYIRHGVAVLSAHTNLDMAKDGMNDLLAKRLSLQSVSGLEKVRGEFYRKISIQLHRGAVEPVMAAMSEAAKGKLNFCTSEGVQWTSEAGGALAAKAIVRLETVCPPELVSKVVERMLEACPEPHPVYDVVEDQSRSAVTYMARMGILPTPQTPEGLLGYVKERLGLSAAGLVCREGMEGCFINRIGVCSGAGSGLLYECARHGVEALITSEIKHHVAVDALEMGIVMIDAGHYGTELLMVPAISKKLEAAFPQLEVLPFVEQETIVYR